MVKKENNEKLENQEKVESPEALAVAANAETKVTEKVESKTPVRSKSREVKTDLGDTEETGVLEERVVQIGRITRVVKGGRRMRFRALVVVGDKRGRVGVAVAKGADVITAISKATNKAKKEVVTINLRGNTIPHEVNLKYDGAVVFLKPASEGTGIIAGGSVRAVLEICGVKDILSKSLGSANKINNVQATFLALKSLRRFEKRVGEDK